MSYRFYLNDYYDITNLVLTLPNIKESIVSEMSDLQYKTEIEVDNKNDWLSSDNPNSIVANTPINYHYLTIYDNQNKNNMIYKGTLSQIERMSDHNCKVVFMGQTENLQKELKYPITKATLIDIAIKLTLEFEIQYDLYSWKMSDEHFQNSIFNIKASEQNTIKLIDLLKQMSESLALWIYIKNDILYCYPIIVHERGYKLSLSNSQILDAEITESYEKMINNFIIRYGVDTTISDANYDNLGKYSRLTYGEKNKELDLTSSANITITNLLTALIIGNSYLKRYKDLFNIITFEVERDIANNIELIDLIHIKKLNKRFVVLDKDYDLNTFTCKLTAWEVFDETNIS